MSSDHALAPELLAILACPACRSGLTEHQADSELVCSGCRRAYPVRDGIPVLLIGSSRIRH